MLWLDFETRSRCDLTVRGAYNYSLDPSTLILCMSYAFGDDDVQSWLPKDPFPEAVAKWTGQIRAHNAAFERLIMTDVLGLDYRLEQFYCTAAQSRANCAPGALGDVGRFAGADMRKDHRGAQLIRLLSIPRSDGTFNNDPDLMAEMVAYCEQDVRAMRAISLALRELSDDELHDYHVNERINDRGVLVDVALAQAAQRYSNAETEEIQQMVVDITQGAVTSVRSPKMRNWVYERVGDQARRLMTRGDKRSIDKNVRAGLLVLAEESPDEVPIDVADVVACADDLWASSVAKFKRLEQLADEEDQRVRGAFVFAGGAATGRASSYGAQVHNFAKKVLSDPQTARDAMVRGDVIVPTFGRRTTDVLKGMLRPALIPAPGHQLVVADWSSIEARVNPWLSGMGQAKLAAFAEGKDVYIVNAASTFGVPEAEVTPDQRQVGKVQELSCGFGGSVGAFNNMGRIYGLVLPEETSRSMVYAWRAANPWAGRFWDRIKSATRRAMLSPGVAFRAGRITYMFDGHTLWYELPSGRILCYPNARTEDGEITYSKASWTPAADAKEWPRASLWYGLACENVTQAVANDLLRAALRACEDRGLRVVLHVHDEIVIETGNAVRDKPILEAIMTTPPSWGTDIPLAAETVIKDRYGK